ncbi:MAG: hypothetical protein IJ662_14020, partial [Clostridia bacterium]|nr:hypothetical protein [Clostridia bacterium]
MSDYNNNQPSSYQAPMRHRRSDRHKASDAGSAASPSPAAPQIEMSEISPNDYTREEPKQWVRQQPPTITTAPEEDEEYQRPQPQRVTANRDQRYMRVPVNTDPEEEDDDEDDEGGAFPWVKALIAAVLVIAVLCGALYFIQDAGPLTPVGDRLRALINGKKEAGQALSFQTVNNSGYTDARLQFHLTTNKAVDGVRLEDEAGNEIVSNASIVSGEGDTNRIWSVTAVFDEPFTGDLYAAIREGDVWTRTAFSVPLVIVAPTPAPTATPLPTQAPVITQAPAVAEAPT